MVVRDGPVNGEAVVWVAEGCKLGVGGKQRVDAGCWHWLEDRGSPERLVVAQTLAFSTRLMDSVLGFVFLHGEFHLRCCRVRVGVPPPTLVPPRPRLE